MTSFIPLMNNAYAAITQPTGFSATASGSGITLNWTAASSDGGEVFTTYTIKMSTTSGFDPSVAGTTVTCTAGGLTTESTATCAVSNTLTAGTTYYFRLGTTYDVQALTFIATEASATTAAATTTTTQTSGNGGGCDGDCEEPTLGVDEKGRRLVSNGFTYNGHAVDVERFFTPYPLITAQVGKQNIAEFKIYENRGPDNITHFTFAFGLDKGDVISESKARIELDRDYDGTETVTVYDPENALDNVKVSTNTVSCSDDSNLQCLDVKIQHMFRAPLDFNIVATDVWDFSRQSWQNYYNHGIEVIGESLNPPQDFSGIAKGHIYHLTEISKTTAVDEFGNNWTFKYGKWQKDFVKNERVSDTASVFTRMHSGFADAKTDESDKATKTLLALCPTCLTSYADFEGSKSIPHSEHVDRMNDPRIIQTMKLESERAAKIVEYLLDPSRYSQ